MQDSGWKRYLGLVLTTAATLLATPIRLALNQVRLFNFGPVGAIGLYGGARLRTWQAFVLPLGLMVATDFALAIFYGDEQYSPLHSTRPWVYGSFLVYVLIGRFVIGSSKSPWVIGAATLLGSAQFYLITNFQAWLEYDHLYARDLGGLVACYVAAWPFTRNSIASDLVFSAVLFGLHAWCERTAPTEANASTLATDRA